jgi:hypothetical protein
VPQGAQRGRHLHSHEPPRLVGRLPAAEEQAVGELDVLGRHPGVVPAHRDECLAPEHPDYPGDHPHARRERLGAANQADHGRELERLERRENGAAVRHAGIPRDGGQPGRGLETSDENPNRQWMDRGVGVLDHQVFPPRLAGARVEPLRLSLVDLVAEHAQAWIATASLPRSLRGVVVGTVVENQYLEVVVVQP